MTHEYVIAQGGSIVGAAHPSAGPRSTAIAWAADRILAVGSDEVVRAISRGDSIFLELGGCAVSPLPSDLTQAEQILRAAVSRSGAVDALDLLVRAQLVAAGAALVPGSRADLAFWSADPGAMRTADAALLRIVAIVEAGAFTTGDEHTGPFDRVAPSS